MNGVSTRALTFALGLGVLFIFGMIVCAIVARYGG